MTKAQINILQLVYPPISNQEAEWLKTDPDVQVAISRSNLYMIVQRAELLFTDFLLTTPENSDSNRLDFVLGSPFHSLTGSIDLDALFELRSINRGECEIEIEYGEKLIRFWASDSQGTRLGDPIDWFTVDKLLIDKSHKHPAILGVDDYASFMNYTLHYVGISTKEDSLSRLVVRPHDKRLRILSNENPIRVGARTTDEIILLFFAVKPMTITTHSFSDVDVELEEEVSLTPVIADAEKALIHVMKSQYNTIQYVNYPKGADGLHKSGLARYGYVVGEGMCLQTQTAEIRGGYFSEQEWPDSIDMIFIEGDKVELMKFDERTKD